MRFLSILKYILVVSDERSILVAAMFTLFTYFFTKEGKSDLGFHPPYKDPFKVLPINNSA